MPSLPSWACLRKYWAAAAFVSAGALAPASAQAQQARALIAVQAKPLGAALVDFAVQANISIATPHGGFGDARATPVRGDLAPREALAGLLQGTGYSFEQVDAVSFRIVVAAAKAPVARDSAPQEVIVTATRRPTMLDRTAVAVTSIDGAYLKETGARDTRDVTFDAAGVTLTNLGPGRNKILMRGLSDGAFSGRTQSTVGLYFDDSRITYGAPDPDLQLVDVQGVELLRGPQGALYGAGPISGFYHIVSRAPDTEQYLASLTAGVSSVDNGGVGDLLEGVVNVPLADGRAGLRVVGYRQDNGGWLDNRRLGLKNANDSERVGGRLSALVKLGDTWAVNARFVSQQIEASDSDYVDLSATQAGRSTMLLEPHATDFFLASVGARGAAAGGELTSTTSYTHHSLSERFDASVASAPFGVFSGRPVAYDDAGKIDLVVQELRYASVASPTPWYVGVFYSDQRKRSDTLITADPDSALPQIGYRATRSDMIQEAAIYGNLSLRLSERAELSLAARYSWASIKTNAEAVGAPVDAFSGTRTESGLAPRIEFSFAASPATFLYVSAAEGYRTGGFNTGFANLLERQAQPAREYSGDSLWSYEAGAKQAFRGGRLRTRVAAFFQNWRDAQSDQLIVLGLPFTGNVGNAQSYGLETELGAQVSSNLQVRAQASYTQAEVTDANPSFPSLPHSGLPGAPRLRTGGSAVYERPLTDSLKLTASGRVRYTGHSNITYSRQRELRIGGYADADIRIGLATKGWRTEFYVDNLLDGSARTFSYGNPLRLGGRGIVAPQTPRTIGVEIHRDF